MNRYDLPAFLGALLVYHVMFAPIVPLVILDMVMSLVADVLDLSGHAHSCGHDTWRLEED
jgi:4-coumarate--CoA ligase